MKNIIFIPFAFKNGYKGGVNISIRTSPFDTYLKNCCVSCISARKNCGRETDVALITNIDVPEPYNTILTGAGVQILKYEFDNFNFNADYSWSLAFYKLNALYHAVEDLSYDNFAYMDSDVYVQSDFCNIWKECSKNILLYDICHGLQVKDYRELIQEINEFTGENSIGLTHYGGEFFAANKQNAKHFVQECLDIYREMLRKSFQTSHGDEFITSLAASHMNCIRNAGAYIYRYWTGAFRLISTNYQFNPVTVLHVPAEKNHGMLRIFDNFIVYDKFPTQKIVWRILHISHPSWKVAIYLKLKHFVKI